MTKKTPETDDKEADAKASGTGTGPEIESVEVACRTCPFWSKVNKDIGQCRRHAPQVLIGAERAHVYAPTATKPDYACGDHPHFEAQRAEALADAIAARMLGENEAA